MEWGQVHPALPSMESIQLQHHTWTSTPGSCTISFPNRPDTFLPAPAWRTSAARTFLYFVNGGRATSRYTIHSSGLLSMNRDNHVLRTPPAWATAGKQLEVGGGLRNKLQFKSRYTNYRKEMYFSFGGYYRFKDAIIAAARFEFKSQKSAFGLGVSYDFGTS